MPYLDPIADLAVRFPNLELMTIEAQHSRGHEDGVLCVPRPKENEEGRLQDRIPPRSGGI